FFATLLLAEPIAILCRFRPLHQVDGAILAPDDTLVHLVLFSETAELLDGYFRCGDRERVGWNFPLCPRVGRHRVCGWLDNHKGLHSIPRDVPVPASLDLAGGQFLVDCSKARILVPST